MGTNSPRLRCMVYFLRMAGQLSEKDRETEALRGFHLQCRFEGQSNKSVWVPVRTRMRVSSFWSQTNSQSGSM